MRCRKIAILTSLVAGKTVDFHKIHTEGIAGIDPTDFAYAKKLDATIKLLAVSPGRRRMAIRYPLRRTF